MEYDNSNRGALWLSQYVDKDGNQQYNGKLDVEGKEYNVAMYIVTSENTKAPKFRLKLQDKEIKQEQPRQAQPKVEEVKVPDPFELFGNSVEYDNSSLPF